MSKKKTVIALTGMEKLPACCDICPLKILNWERKYVCGVTGLSWKKSDRDFNKKRQYCCPLMEVEDETV